MFYALLAKDPGDGVSYVALTTTVRTNDGGDAIPGKYKFGVVREGFKASDFQALQFEHAKDVCRPRGKTQIYI
jgi:hypothetical protein